MRDFTIPLFLFGIILFAAFSCEKDDICKLNYEIPISGTNKAISFEKQGLIFEFYLFNEEHEVKTVFSAEEFLNFHFSIKNTTTSTINIKTDFIGEDFFRIYQIRDGKNTDVGRSWTSIFCEFALPPDVFELNTDEILLLEIPWIENPELINASYYPFCVDSQDDNILKGEYYTELNFDLNYSTETESYLIEDVLLTINFKVE